MKKKGGFFAYILFLTMICASMGTSLSAYDNPSYTGDPTAQDINEQYVPGATSSHYDKNYNNYYVDPADSTANWGSRTEERDAYTPYFNQPGYHLDDWDHPIYGGPRSDHTGYTGNYGPRHRPQPQSSGMSSGYDGNR